MRNEKQINAAIATFIRGQKNRRETIQNLGVECLEYAKENGNTGPLAKLIQGMTDVGSHDAKVVQSWAYACGPFKSAKNKEDGSLIIKMKGKKDEIDLDKASTVPWYEFKKPPAPSEFKPENRIAGLVKAMVEKGNMTPDEIRQTIESQLPKELEKYRGLEA